MKLAQKSILRIKDMLRRDKENIPEPLINLIKNDVYSILNNYLEISPNDINLKYFIDDENLYNFEVALKTNRVKKVNFLNI